MAENRTLIINEDPVDLLEEYPQSDVFLSCEDVLPDKYSLCDRMTIAKDQGKLGTCTSFAVVACLEYIHNMLDLSEAMLSHMAETIHDDCFDGLSLAAAIHVAHQLGGVVEEGEWPYDTSKGVCWGSPPAVEGLPHYSLVWPHRIFHRTVVAARDVVEQQIQAGVEPADSSYSRCIKKALVYMDNPVAISVPTFDRPGFDAGWIKGPHIQMPTREALEKWLPYAKERTGLMYHAIAVCAYDDASERFWFKNSWGTGWGANGYGTLPYQYVDWYCQAAWVNEGQP